MNKNYALPIGIVSFVILLYGQDAGLNLSIFALLIWIITYLSFKRNTVPHFWKLSVSFFISCMSSAWYGDAFSLIALILSLSTTVLHVRYPGLRMILFPLMGAVTIFTFPFRLFLMKGWLPDSFFKKGTQKWLATAIIPLLLLVTFSGVYASGSEYMKNFFLHLTINFNPGQIILLSILGFFILFNLWFLWLPSPVARLNVELGNHYATYAHPILPSFSFFTKNDHTRGGIISFVLLNLLLIFFVCTYTYEQFIAAPAYELISQSVHQRIATVIGSIVLAILLILVYFKSPTSKDKNGRILTWLAYIWIALNTALILAAFLKNAEYMIAYGLTFKRVSVFLFLILCLIGLLFTTTKINQQKTNAYLIHSMMWTFYWAITLLAPVNFSYLVTRYNLANGKSDPAYVRQLPFNKSILLSTYAMDDSWAAYTQNTIRQIEQEKKKSFLSSGLYFKTLSLPEK